MSGALPRVRSLRSAVPRFVGACLALGLYGLAVQGASARPGSPDSKAAGQPDPGAEYIQQLRRGSPNRVQVDRQRRMGEIDQTRWQSELRYGQIDRTLRRFFAGIQGQGFSPEQRDSLFAESFRGSVLSDFPELSEQRNGLLFGEYAGPSGTELATTGFAIQTARYARGFSDILRTEHHVPHLETVAAVPDGEKRFLATVEFRITGAAADGRREDQGIARVEMVPDPARAGAWLMDRFELKEFRTLRGRVQFEADGDAVPGTPARPTDTFFPAYFAQGVTLADIDGDLDPDLLVPERHEPARLYVNDGSGNFEDRTESLGLAGLAGVRSGYFFDWDNDGDLDLLILTRARIHLLERSPEGFDDVSARSGFNRMKTDGLTGAAIGDYDDDGLLDFYIANYGNPNRGPGLGYFDSSNGFFNKLFRNEGEGRFSDQTRAAGLEADNRRWTYAALWIDFDDDNRLDLYVVNDYGPNQLFRNNGEGVFEDVAAGTGVTDYGNGMGASWADYDNDGRPDLYISNMRSHAGQRMLRSEDYRGSAAQLDRALRFAKGNTLLRNAGSGGFEEVASSAAVDAKWAWGNAFLDYDNDGDLDLYVANGMFSNTSTTDIDPVFWRHILLPISVASRDYEHGTRYMIDLLVTRTQSLGGYERNRFFQNLGNGEYMDGAAVVGADLVQDSRGVATGDIDGDGDLDLVVSNRNAPKTIILKNTGNGLGNYLAVDTVGRSSNRQGIGARVRLRCGDLEQVRDIQLGTGYVSQSPQTAWFGLGDCGEVERLSIRWPSGERQSHEAIPVNRRVIVTEGVAELRGVR